MRVVVTGSTGFIGRSLVALLLETGNQVCVLSKNTTADFGQEIKVIYYKSSLVECTVELSNWQPELFYHLAWRGVDNTKRNIEENNLYNYELALDSILLASETGCSQWIGAGSQAEYGVGNKKLNENDACKPVNNYGITKYKLSFETEQLCKKYNMMHCWVRIFSIYGPNDHGTSFISYLIKTMLKKQIPQISSCTQIWDYLFIEDAVKALLSLRNAQGIYNIASGTPVILKNVVEFIALITGYNDEIMWGYKQDTSLHYLVGGIEKISSRTGWRPSVSLHKGLIKTVSSYHL
jgi:UDP-glucose 4-epimerase